MKKHNSSVVVLLHKAEIVPTCAGHPNHTRQMSCLGIPL